MKVFYGAAIQGNRDRGERQRVHRDLLTAIKVSGCSVVSEHTAGADYSETAGLLAESLGPLPSEGTDRSRFIRDKMIQFIEGDIKAAVFEVSVPSLGTGIEIAHAYLRPRMGLTAIPILALYETDYWPHHLSTMIRGIAGDDNPNFLIEEYSRTDEASIKIHDFLTDDQIRSGPDKLS
jgi:hypothetical protein